MRFSAPEAFRSDTVVEGQVAASRQAFLGHAVLYGVFSLLLLAPLAFGAVEPWSIFVLQAGAVTLFVLWALQQAWSAEVQIAGNPLFAPMLVFAALIALQLLPGLSAYRYITFSTGLLYGSFGILSFLAVQCVHRNRDVKALAVVFSIYGFVVALFALLQSFTSRGKLYWIRTPRSGGWIYGPYVNHNHYAGLMELLLPVSLVVLFGGKVRGGPRILLGFATVLMASTIFLSGSRGGMVAFAVQLALLATFLGTRGRNPRAALALGVLVLAVGCALVWLGGSSLADRLSSIHSEARTELSGGVRLAINRDGLRMFFQKPVVGFGLGTFPIVYPRFRSFFTNMFVNEAHNDYLQLLVEMGMAGFATMLWFLWLLFRNGLRKLRDGPSSVNGGLALATLLGCTGILVHSFVDFNLQVPANAALFYVFAALAASAPLPENHHRRRPPMMA